MEQGDPSSVGWCAAFKQRVSAQFDSLDLLVCNAAPTVQSLRIEASCYERITDYLQNGFALVAAPLTSFLDLVSASNGRVLLISSSYVEEAPAIFPQYVALKSAVEGLLRSAANSHPKVTFWAARPGKLRTDMTNTPMGWLDAEDPHVVAGRIVAAISQNGEPGTLQLCS